MFLFRLALQLGRTVNELLHTVSYIELKEWAELYSFDPWGEERSDIRSAMHMALVANQSRDKRKRSTPFSYTDFLPFKDAMASATKRARSARTRRRGAHIAPETLTYLFLKAGQKPPSKG